jgi:[NiFe] hydrogenase diaphorase moiety large subunit
MDDRINGILEKFHRDRTRLMDILLSIQDEIGYIPESHLSIIAESLNISEAEVEQTLSFYHFFSTKPRGKYRIYLNNSVVANMMGRAEVAATFEKELGIKFGQVTPDGLVGLFETSCIGMNDQEPAAIINNYIFSCLTPFRVKEIIRDIKEGKRVEEMFDYNYGEGQNATELIRSMVLNNIRKVGPVLDSHYKVGDAIKKIVKMSPEEVIDEIKKSNIRGRGGAGFPTGSKWEFCRKAPGAKKYIFCNADEGEPGTFKDRVILTELPRLLMEGMIIAGYAVGATEGILYVRYEYKYLQQYLEEILENARKKHYLGKSIGGKKDFDFDIRIQFGAGAYVCGEESALIESAEGKRGEPRDRPPFPVEKGYFDMPTVVNNVETLCSVVKIILNGGEWYKSFGTAQSTGTKLLSISGDCRFPGVYEVEWGFSVNDILDMVGAEKSHTQAVQVGGPSGSLIGPDEFNRILGYEDLSTGGSLIIFNRERDLLNDVVLNFTSFFIDESCGSCSTCRIIPVLLRRKIEKILNARGVENDIEEIKHWAEYLKASRCGLGQTAANPILTSIKNFYSLYETKIQKNKDFDSGFDLTTAVRNGAEATGRLPIV